MQHASHQISQAKQAYAHGEHGQVISICEQLTARLGLRDDVLNLKAMSLLALGRVEEAESSIRLALKLNPRIAGMHLNAASVYVALSQNSQARQHALEAVRLAARDARVLNQAALMVRMCGDYSQALRIIDRCLHLQPEFSVAWYLKGSLLLDMGISDAAQVALEKAVELDPGNVVALSSLVAIRGERTTDVETVTQLQNIRQHSSSPQDRASAMFVLAGMHHRDSQYDEAFSLLTDANSLVNTALPFDISGWEKKAKQVRQVSALPGALTPLSSSSDVRITFIIGMPRSGTTLCEQVLSTNSAVLACGELAAVGSIESGFVRRGVDPYAPGFSENEMEHAVRLYLSVLPKNYRKFQCVTDKAPMNFERIGLIHRMFPNARFVYCKRHPLDTILSCFMQDFQAGLAFASDLENICRTYIDHVQTMRHWTKLLPAQIHVFDYEAFISNQEAETRRLAEFLNLEFKQDMLTPHKQKRTVGTASNLQVRQAVYSSSVGRWKKYQSHLSAVIELLVNAGLLDKDLGDNDGGPIA